MPRRSMQDWSSWQNFGTQAFWAEVQSNPAFAGELILQRLCKGGLQNPSEQTSGDICAGILLATHGSNATLLPIAEVDRMFDWVKAHQNFRQQVLRSRCPCAVTTALGPKNRLECVCAIYFSVSFRPESSNWRREKRRLYHIWKASQARQCNYLLSFRKCQGFGSAKRICLARHHFHQSPSTRCARALTCEGTAALPRRR